MLKIGAILFAIGVFLLFPFDEIFILLPLIAFYGIGVIPIYYGIALSFFIVGAVLMGVHIFPFLFSHPIGIIMLIIAFIIAIYLVLTGSGFIVTGY